MARPKPFVRGSDDPQARALSDLDDKPRPEARPRARQSGHTRPIPPDFPECPAERSERTWRLVRLFVETGEAYGRVRVVSPWHLGKELAAKINADRDILDFIKEHGQDFTQDLLSRMIRIYWKHYVTDSMSRTQVLNEYLDDYWDDLWDQAKTEYATDCFQRLDAEGKLKTTPHLIYRDDPGPGSLLNDAEYQAALQDIRTTAKLREQVAEHQLASVETEDDEPQS